MPIWLLAVTVIAVIAGAGLAAYFSALAIPIVIGLVILLAAIILIFDKPWLGVLLVAFFLPFERIGGFDIVGQTTLKISQVFAAATIISWLFYYLLIKRRAFVVPKILWPVLAYIAIAAISILNAANTGRAVSVFLFTLFVMIFALIIPQVVFKTKHVRKIVFAILLAAVIVSLFGLYQFAGDVVGLPETITGLRSHYTESVFGFPRIHSTASEPLYFANYLLIPIALAVMLFLLAKPKQAVSFWRSRSFYLIAIVLTVMALVLTLSRGGYLGLIATAVMLLILGWRYVWRAKNILIFVGIGAVVAIAAIAFINFSGNFSLDTFLGQATELEQGAGIVERQETYDQAIDLFWQHPLTGIGIGNFGPEVAKYAHKMPESGWAIVNNEPLELLVETGILGAAAIASVIIIVIWQAIVALRQVRFLKDEKKRRLLYAILAGLLAAFIGIIVQYQTFSTLYIMHVWFVIGLIIAMISIIKLKTKP
ncbi:O-antigen ligase family protein [Patescibacteria group bacterium]